MLRMAIGLQLPTVSKNENLSLNKEYALKNVLKNVQESFFLILKYLKNKLDTIFKTIFHAESEYVFGFFYHV